MLSRCYSDYGKLNAELYSIYANIELDYKIKGQMMITNIYLFHSSRLSSVFVWRNARYDIKYRIIAVAMKDPI